MNEEIAKELSQQLIKENEIAKIKDEVYFYRLQRLAMVALFLAMAFDGITFFIDGEYWRLGIRVFVNIVCVMAIVSGTVILRQKNHSIKMLERE